MSLCQFFNIGDEGTGRGGEGVGGGRRGGAGEEGREKGEGRKIGQENEGGKKRKIYTQGYGTLRFTKDIRHGRSQYMYFMSKIKGHGGRSSMVSVFNLGERFQVEGYDVWNAKLT